MPTRVVSKGGAYITLVEAKLHLRVTNDAEDGLITALIDTAIEMVESFTRRSLSRSTYELNTKCLDTEMQLEYPPLLGVSSVTYHDENNDEQNIPASDYEVNNVSMPGMIRFTGSLSGVYDRWDAVKITYTAGYADMESIPSALKSATLLIIGHLYEHRSDVVVGRMVTSMPQNSLWLMNPYKIYS